jgi:hypothetical protein
MMDIAAAVEYLLPNAHYRRAATYEQLVETWSDPRPIPTRQELEAAWAQIQIIDSNRNATLVNIRNTAQSAVGVALEDLTQAQIQALLAVVLWQAGGVTPDGKVAPLSAWVGDSEP